MNARDAPSAAALIEQMTGYWVSQAVHLAAKLGLADLLRDGPRTSRELAGSCGAHAPALYRLLRGLASVGVFAEVGGDFFDALPGGGDAYVLAQILHAWDDARSTVILTNRRRAWRRTGRSWRSSWWSPPATTGSSASSSTCACR